MSSCTRDRKKQHRPEAWSLRASLAWALHSDGASFLATCCLLPLSGGLSCIRHSWRLTVILLDPSKFLGWILIDRCGKHFGTILNYLRDDTITLPQNRQEIQELMAEAKYYLIQGLVNMCQTALQVQEEVVGLASRESSLWGH